MEIKEQQQGAVTVLKPIGPLTAGDAEAFKARLTDALGTSLGRLVVDASGVPFVDSRGVEVLLDATEELAQGGRALKLCAATETVRTVLELTGVSFAFEYFDDASAGVRSFL